MRRELARTTALSDLRGIYGDEINARNGRRLECRSCGRFLDGPVSLAKSRAHETDRPATTHRPETTTDSREANPHG